jgi:plastin-1
MRFKAVENTNYAIELGKQMRFSLVGVQGADITDGQRTLTLGLVWQLMRRDISETLSALAQRLGKREITDNEMVKWANDMSKKGGEAHRSEVSRTSRLVAECTCWMCSMA